MRDLVLSYGHVLEQVGSFEYLGLVLTQNGSFTAAVDSHVSNPGLVESIVV